MTRLAGALMALLLLAGCAFGEQTRRGTPRADSRCGGLSYDDVRGPAPSYGNRTLLSHPTSHALCAAYWIAHSDDGFVLQGLALRGHTAYVGGYGWVPTRTQRACQIARIDLRTGRTTGFTPRFAAPVYGPSSTYCRHGGGLEITDEGLWVAEAERLWLLDPDRIGNGDPVLRVWRMQRGIKGSALVIAGGRVGFPEYRSEGTGEITWFDLDDVLRPGVDELRRKAQDATDAAEVDHGHVPNRLQGIADGPGGVWYSSSRIVCGVLRGPKDQEVSSVPGAEDIAFRGRSLWVVSEAGSKPWAGDGDLVPMLLRLDREAVLATPSTCDF